MEPFEIEMKMVDIGIGIGEINRALLSAEMTNEAIQSILDAQHTLHNLLENQVRLAITLGAERGLRSTPKAN